MTPSVNMEKNVRHFTLYFGQDCHWSNSQQNRQKCILMGRFDIFVFESSQKQNARSLKVRLENVTPLRLFQLVFLSVAPASVYTA